MSSSDKTRALFSSDGAPQIFAPCDVETVGAEVQQSPVQEEMAAETTRTRSLAAFVVSIYRFTNNISLMSFIRSYRS